MDKYGNPRLGDFGLSRMEEEGTLWKTSASGAGGTTRWKSPELLDQTQPTVTTSGDVYAYAMTSLV